MQEQEKPSEGLEILDQITRDLDLMKKEAEDHELSKQKFQTELVSEILESAEKQLALNRKHDLGVTGGGTVNQVSNIPEAHSEHLDQLFKEYEVISEDHNRLFREEQKKITELQKNLENSKSVIDEDRFNALVKQLKDAEQLIDDARLKRRQMISSKQVVTNNTAQRYRKIPEEYNKLKTQEPDASIEAFLELYGDKIQEFGIDPNGIKSSVKEQYSINRGTENTEQEILKSEESLTEIRNFLEQLKPRILAKVQEVRTELAKIYQIDNDGTIQINEDYLTKFRAFRQEAKKLRAKWLGKEHNKRQAEDLDKKFNSLSSEVTETLDRTVYKLSKMKNSLLGDNSGQSQDSAKWLLLGKLYESPQGTLEVQKKQRELVDQYEAEKKKIELLIQSTLDAEISRLEEEVSKVYEIIDNIK